MIALRQVNNTDQCKWLLVVSDTKTYYGAERQMKCWVLFHMSGEASARTSEVEVCRLINDMIKQSTV